MAKTQVTNDMQGVVNMRALISPNENNRICQIETDSFPVAEPLFWEDCTNDVTVEWTYDNSIFSPPVVVPVVDPVVDPAVDPVAKLKLFLANNHDVAKLLGI